MPFDNRAADADAPPASVDVASVADVVVPEAGAGRIGQRHAEQGDELVVHLLAESPDAENDVTGNRLFRGNLEMVDLFWMELRARRRR